MSLSSSGYTLGYERRQYVEAFYKRTLGNLKMDAQSILKRSKLLNSRIVAIILTLSF